LGRSVIPLTNPVLDSARTPEWKWGKLTPGTALPHGGFYSEALPVGDSGGSLEITNLRKYKGLEQGLK